MQPKRTTQEKIRTLHAFENKLYREGADLTQSAKTAHLRLSLVRDKELNRTRIKHEDIVADINEQLRLTPAATLRRALKWTGAKYKTNDTQRVETIIKTRALVRYNAILATPRSGTPNHTQGK